MPIQNTPAHDVTPRRRLMQLALAAIVATTAWCALAPRAQAQAQDIATARQLRLMAGAQKELRSAQPVERVAVGNPAVADALILRTRGAPSVLLVAKQPGVTDVMVWTRGSAEPQSYSVQVDAIAPDANGAQLGYSAAGATITGQSPDAYGAARAQAAARAATAGKTDGKPGLVVDRSTVPLSGTVQVDVKVVEISKTVLKEVGINFFRNNSGFAFGTFSPSTLNKFTFTPGSGGAPGSFSADIASPMSNAFNLVAASLTHGIFANISLLEANGLARVLAEPSLVALSGQSASFLAGGEIPIPVPQALGTTTIQFKPFGIGLTVSPTVLSADRIALKVAPEASDLDPSRGISINGAVVPAIVTRRADTTVELGDGESFVIGGLVSRNTVSNVNKVPVLGDLPVIGVFFKNLNFHQEDRELMIVVTPRLVKPMAKNSPAAQAVGADGRTGANPNVWGWYVMGEYADPTLPGFSK
ncbi:type II and III secretion system protein family protein [Cupriavidus neocaledonicus]|uniref:Pilus assembly protein CpaC n=1 Tax=Cupriavidus neocaledonicus TaxID=1040979 RepID=A0A375HVL6_9BURK|nr:type II and III secretion system protein family protein [Cupriavidus neocaledonicus]SOZ39608.1 putative Type II secretion system protein; putative precursor [Cupriavidus neocaledonicus]SPD61066.1 Pilus assembly protein CpaC [Cupriavidus neocaledonicus]